MTVPILVDIRATTAPTNNDIFAATIVRAKISFPKLSVPNQCVADGANSLCSGSIYEGVKGNHSVAANVENVMISKLLIAIAFRLLVSIMNLPFYSRLEEHTTE